MPKLVEALIHRGIVSSISTETVRRILRANRISYQRTKTWKESKDPAFREKWDRVKALYVQEPPKNTAVVCIDEFDPIELRPYAGDHWAPEKHPQRLPATFNRPYGVRHFLAYYDVHANYPNPCTKRFWRPNAGGSFIALSTGFLAHLDLHNGLGEDPQTLTQEIHISLHTGLLNQLNKGHPTNGHLEQSSFSVFDLEVTTLRFPKWPIHYRSTEFTPRAGTLTQGVASRQVV